MNHSLRNKVRFVICIICISSFVASVSAQINSPLETKVQTIFKQLTLEEKIGLLHGCSGFEVGEITRLKVPKIKMTDGPQGVRGPISTYFPTGIAYAATWNAALVDELGKAIGRETKAAGCGVILGPGVNIMRTPLNGRNFEYFGEDPYLAGATAVAYINGVQSTGVAATVKHMALNNQEICRTTISSQIDEQSLHEIYLPAFKMACDAGVWSIMSSYNKINGTYAAHNRYLQYDVTKMGWNWDGIVMSDWGGVHDSWGAAMGGLDLEMPGGSKDDYMADGLLKLVKDGKIPEAIIDEKVIRVLRFIYRIYDNPSYKIPTKANSPENVQVARKIADESIVLLKNDGILPLSNNIKTIAIIGPSAKYQHAMHGLMGSGGSGAVTPPYEVTPFQAIFEKYGKQTKILFAEGISFEEGLDLIPSECLMTDGKQGLKGEYWSNPNFKGKSLLIKTDKIINFTWTPQVASGDGVPQGLMSAKWTGTLTPNETGNYQLGTQSDDGSRLYVNNVLLVDNWGDHDMQTKSNDIMLQAGKSYTIRIEYANTGGKGGLKLVWKKPAEKTKMLADAIEVASKADLVLYFGGINHSYDKEAIGWGDVKGADHADYNLIGKQNELIQAIAKVNPNLIVTLIGGTPMNVEPFVDKTKALLMAWYPGQEGGHAIADILSGKVNPSAKLPCTWGKNITDYAPHAQGNYPGTGDYGIVNYDEGMFVGYRWFDKKNIVPRYPFGFGMSYTTFSLSTIKVENQSEANNTKVVVTCTIKNTGKVDGAEVVQIYTGLPNARQERPIKELRSFQKIFLKAGEEKSLSFTLDKTAFSAYYVSESSAWKLVKGKANIFVGTSSQNVSMFEVLIK